MVLNKAKTVNITVIMLIALKSLRGNINLKTYVAKAMTITDKRAIKLILLTFDIFNR